MTLDECIKEQWQTLVKQAEKLGHDTDKQSIIELLDDEGTEGRTFRSRAQYASGYLRGAAEFADLTLGELLEDFEP